MTLRSRCRIWLGCIAIFVLGIISGVAGTGLYVKERVIGVLSGDPVASRNNLGRLFSDHLHLNSEQRDTVAKSFAKAHRRIYELRALQRQDHLSVLHDLRSELSPGLTEEQMLKLEILYREIERRILHNPFASQPLTDVKSNEG